MSEDCTTAEAAVMYVMGRIIRDPQVAYLLGPGSEAYRLVTDAVAEIRGESGDAYRAYIGPSLRTEPVIARSIFDDLSKACDRMIDERLPA